MHASSVVDRMVDDPFVLLIESNPITAYDVVDALQKSPDAFHVNLVNSIPGAFRAIGEHTFDVVVFDAQSASVRAVTPVLVRLRQRLRDTPIVVMTTTADERWAVDAMQRGATHVLARQSGQLPDIARTIGVALERRRVAEALREQASRDKLTRLANRSALSRSLKAAIARSAQTRSRFALMLLDLDGFKQINDTLGHAGGDEALRIVASRLTNEMTGCDIIARVGGDEFSILVSDVGEMWRPLGIAESVLEIVGRPMVVDGMDVELGCRVGIAVYPQSGRTEADLLKAADQAMYAAKDGVAPIRLHLPDGMPQWTGNRPDPDPPGPQAEQVDLIEA